MSDQDSSIVAIATPPGSGGIGVLRVSGPVAAAIATQLLGSVPQPRHAHFTTFRKANGQAIDQGLLLYFPAPHSYTGEDVVELHGHGSPLLLDMLLQRVCELGARLAQPGEFSARAFLNGKLDLLQAEAVADLIAAGSEAAARAALRSLEGEFSRRVQQLQDDLIALRVQIEVAIDFPDDDIDFLADPGLLQQHQTLCKNLQRLLSEARHGVQLAAGLHVVIVGRPNTGKSSLLNALSASERAIVTAVPGTTRDVIEVNLQLDGVQLTLADTAGLRDSDDPIECEGIRRTTQELARADLLLLISDKAHIEEDERALATWVTGKECLSVLNKIDLDNTQPACLEYAGKVRIALSASTGVGLDLLRRELRRRAGAESAGEHTFSARSRHLLALQRTLSAVLDTGQLLREQRAGELAAESLREAQQALGEITGKFIPDDLLGAIFSSFCIGK